MSKLSEPVAKAFETLMKYCNNDSIKFMRAVTSGTKIFSCSNEFQNAFELLRCANFTDIMSALVEFDLARSANKATEQPSAAAAVEGILTEEELKMIERTYGAYNPTLQGVIESHRNLLSANAELSFKNGKLQREVKYLRDNYELKEDTK